jgi:hypothetical protein
LSLNLTSALQANHRQATLVVEFLWEKCCMGLTDEVPRRTVGGVPPERAMNTTVALGIPIPSTDPIFLSIVGVHVLFGLAAVIAGVVAMLNRKGRGRHSSWGKLYFWFLFGLFGTMSMLSFMRWAENYHLFILGTLSFASACLGRLAAQRRWQQWVRFHLSGMGASYILMLTAFYVDNGKNLPVWRELPQIAFWLLPSAIGVPVIVYTLFRHPLVLALCFRQETPRPRQ